MRRRPNDSAPSEELLLFDGREFVTGAEWEAAFDAWHEARARWLARHPGVVDLPQRVLSDCPWDGELI